MFQSTESFFMLEAAVYPAKVNYLPKREQTVACNILNGSTSFPIPPYAHNGLELKSPKHKHQFLYS